MRAVHYHVLSILVLLPTLLNGCPQSQPDAGTAAAQTQGGSADAAAGLADSQRPRNDPTPLPVEVLVASPWADGLRPLRSPNARQIVHIESFNDLGAWEVGASNGTLSAELDQSHYTSASGGLISQQGALRLVAEDTVVNADNSVALALKHLATPVDLTGASLAMHFFIHDKLPTPTSDWRDVLSLTLFLFDADNHFRYYNLWENTGSTGLHKGWELNTRHVEQFEYQTDPPLDIAAVSAIQFRIEYRRGKSAAVTLDKLEFFRNPPIGRVLLRFDDAYVSQFPAAAYLASRGMAGSFGIVASAIDLPGHLTVDQLSMMHEAGHLILNHSWEHLDWDEISDDAFLSDIDRCTDYLAAHGMTEGARVWISPLGRWHENALALLRPRLNFMWLSYSIGGPVRPEPLYDPTLLHMSHQVKNAPEAIAAVNQAAEHKLVASLFWHSLDIQDSDWTDFVAIVEHIRDLVDAGKIIVVTPLDLLRDTHP